MYWKVVSFDFDNTLGLLDPPVHVTIATILERHGVPVDHEEIRRIRVRGRSDTNTHPLMEKKGWGSLTDTEKNQVLADGNRLLLKKIGIRSNLDYLAKAINDEWFAVRRLYPDVPEAFKRLREMGIHIAILAGPSSTTVKAVLESHNLARARLFRHNRHHILKVWSTPQGRW